MSTADELESRYTAIEEECNTFIGSLERELALAEKERFTLERQNQLKDQIKKSRATYDDILTGLQGQIKTAREKETQAAAAKQAQQQLTADQEKQQMYQKLRAAWIEQHGDPQLFDESFPQLYAEEMRRRTLNASQEKPESRANRTVINRTF
jgi:HD-GYP domain-containing protein (c-di-GMP phosphodiesterase class II)